MYSTNVKYKEIYFIFNHIMEHVHCQGDKDIHRSVLYGTSSRSADTPGLGSNSLVDVIRSRYSLFDCFLVLTSFISDLMIALIQMRGHLDEVNCCCCC